MLAPFGFFDRNPSLDVPPAKAAHCASRDADMLMELLSGTTGEVQC